MEARSGGAATKLLMSAPVENERSPAPVTTAARISGSSRTRIQAADSPA